MSVIHTNLIAVSNYTLLPGKSPLISQNFMNSNDNKTNRQGYDFSHDNPKILVRSINVGYFAIKNVVLTCCIEPKEKPNR
jgi:hypothetical protein